MKEILSTLAVWATGVMTFITALAVMNTKLLEWRLKRFQANKEMVTGDETDAPSRRAKSKRRRNKDWFDLVARLVALFIVSLMAMTGHDKPLTSGDAAFLTIAIIALMPPMRD